jgi:hypothetical protein
MNDQTLNMPDLPPDDTGAPPSVYARYGRVLAILLVAAMIGVAGLNVLVDPFGAYPALSIDSLRKYESERGSRTYRAERVRRGDLNVLLTGTSRVLIALDPSHVQLEGATAYNAALSGASMGEVASLVEYAMEHNPDLKLIVLGLDFFMFNGRRFDHADDYLLSRLNKDQSVLAYHLGGLFSERFLWSSLTTLWYAATGRLASCTDDGRLILPDSKKQLPPVFAFEKSLRDFAEQPDLYSEFSYNHDSLDELQRLLVKAQSKGIRIVCYTNDIHAALLEWNRLLNMWPMFEQWKRDLVGVVEAANSTSSMGANAGAEIRLFDFTGCTPINTEQASKRTKPNDPLQWFFDASHSYPSVGDLELAIILADNPPAPTDSFGVLLTSENVEEHILLVRRELDQWEKDYPDELAWVKSLLQPASAGDPDVTREP